MGSPWIVVHPRSLFSEILMAFVRMAPLNVLAKFEIRSFFGQSLDIGWIGPRFLFSKIFHWLLFGWTLLLFWPNLKFVALPVREIIAIGVLCGVRTPSLGEREAVGVPFERAKVNSYRPP